MNLVAISINLIVSVLAVAIPSKTGTQIVYGAFLCPLALLLSFFWIGKYLFLFCTNNWKPCICACCVDADKLGEEYKKLKKRCQKLEYCIKKACLKEVAYDIVNFIMIFFYLLGDNLQEMVCNEKCGPCPRTAQAFTGISLILNLALTVLKGAGEGNLPSALPVVGKWGDTYNKMLQIAASAVTIDQALTAILEAFTKGEQECEKVVSSDRDAQIAFMASMMAIAIIVIFAVQLLLCWEKRENFCHACCTEERHTEERRTEYCCTEDCCAVFLQWLFAFYILIFMGVFLAADIDWIWDVITGNNLLPLSAAWITRLVLLVIATLSSLVFLIVYITVICLPGLRFVLVKKRFFLPEHNTLSVSEAIVREKHNTWKEADEHYATVDNTQWAETAAKHSKDEEGGKSSKIKSSVEVEDSLGGKATISFTFKEEIPNACLSPCNWLCRCIFCCKCKDCKEWNLPKEEKVMTWLMQANIKGIVDETIKSSA